MARRIVSTVTFTPVAYADTTNMASANYANILQGGSATQMNWIWEVSISGQAASSSSPTFMILGRDSTTAATNSNSTGQTDAPLNVETAALGAPALTGSTNTTNPQRSSTLHLQNCSLNAFGGNYFWRANRMEESVIQVGASASSGETSLSAYTGGTPGAIGVHMIYESA
jgi:hypothetical protein